MEIKWTDKMRNILGNNFEQNCRNMVIAGAKWIQDHPGEDHRIIAPYIPEQPDEGAWPSMLDAMGQVPSHHEIKVKDSACTAVVWIGENGWDTFVEYMEKEPS